LKAFVIINSTKDVLDTEECIELKQFKKYVVYLRWRHSILKQQMLLQLLITQAPQGSLLKVQLR